MTSVGQLVVLSILNWLHLVAVVVWIGAMTANMFVVLPSAAATLPPPVMGKFMGALMKRFRVIAYSCIVTLIVTGFLMMIQNADYLGLLKVQNGWTIVLLVKHIVIAVLVILAIYSFEVLAPQVGKMAAKGPSPELAVMQARQMKLARFGLLLGMIILAL